jgi:hypothetical protein
MATRAAVAAEAMVTRVVAATLAAGAIRQGFAGK